MAYLHYEIDIKAPKQKVWEIMLGDITYREWTSVFHAGSYYEGSWDKGSKIKFLALDEGKPSGMSSHIVENRPYEYISIEHLGEVINGTEDLTSENARQWAGSHENYTFNEVNGITTLTIELEGDGVNREIAEMFDAMWPKALQKLKEIVEQSPL